MISPESDYREIRLRDGRALAYIERGDLHGRPIIYCHGSPSSRVEVDLIVRTDVACKLALRLIVPDRPGMGHSTFQPDRRIVDWPSDVLQLADALGLGRFAVLGASGGSPYAAACGVQCPDRIEVIGLLGGVAPFDAPGILAGTSGALRMMIRLARFAPGVLRVLFRFNLRAMRGQGERSSERMATWFPEPDRTLMRTPAIRDGYLACFVEACRQGPRGPVRDLALIGRPWGFDLASLKVPVALWQGEQDRNVPSLHGQYLASVISDCRATFYPNDAHISVPLHHQQEILDVFAA